MESPNEEVIVSEGYFKKDMERVPFFQKSEELSDENSINNHVVESKKESCCCCKLIPEVGGSLFNVINGIVGAGILGFPYAFYSAGMFTTSVVTIIISFLCLTTLIIVIYAAKESEADSYQDIMKYFFGTPGKLAGEFFVIFYMEGACIVYLTVISQSIMPVMNEINFDSTDSFFASKWFIIIAFSMMFIFPLSLLREIGFLSPTSFVAFISAIYLVVFVTIMSFVKFVKGEIPTIPSKHRGDFFIFNTDTISGFPFFFLSVPIVSFAFQCHGVCIPIFAEFIKKETTKPKLRMCLFLLVAILAIIIVTILYFFIGISGFLNFQNHTKDNILMNYSTNAGVILGRLAVGATATFSYPVQNFAAKLVIQSFLFQGKKMGLYKFLIISIIQFIFNVVLAILVPSLSTIFGFVGSIGCPFLMFIFPALMMLKMSCFKGRFMCFLKWVLLPIYMFLGVGFCIAGIVVTIFKVVNSTEPKK